MQHKEKGTEFKHTPKIKCPSSEALLTSETGDPRKNRDHLDHSTVEIGSNSLKSPGYLKRYAVTSVKKKKNTC